MAGTHRFLQYIASPSKNNSNKLLRPAGAAATVLLRCHVKPGAAKAREGVTALTDDAVELCVAAAARDGESNRAVLGVLSKALDVPKSDLQITRGSKSRQKIITIGGRAVRDGEAECVERLLRRLGEAVEGNK